jgi:two-component system, sensor histidine kinase and response regulator
MRQFFSVKRADQPDASTSFDLKPTLADDAWAVLLARVAIVIILVSQPLFIISEVRLGGVGGVNPNLLTAFHLFNFTVALVGLSLSWTERFHKHWRAALFALGTMIILSSTLMSIAAGGRHEALFLTLLHIMLGSALLVPWEPRWQFVLGVICILAQTANVSLAHNPDPNAFYHWLGLLTAACLAQFATAFGVRYRERTNQYKALRERDLQLGESEEKFRRVFETSSDVIVITNAPDGRILDVNREFVDCTGYGREEVVGRKPSELDLWNDREQLKDLADEIMTNGFVRNAEGNFRMRNGDPVSALISSVRATINGQECVISALRDVTQLRKAHEELIAAREAALAASEAKTRFLSCMSHEIRTPLNVILGSADMLTDTALVAEQRHFLERIVKNGSILLELLNSILDLTRVESGQLRLEQNPFDPAEVAERVADTLAIRAHEGAVELVARIAPDVPATLLGDSLRLNQVLTNLIGNAIKFTERGEIVVGVARDEESNEPGVLHFQVRDTGVGIPREKFATIFSPFAQADSSTTRKYGGSGLGLSIVEHLVTLMGGRVWVESEVGKGSTFHFTARFGVPENSGEAPAQPRDDALRGARVLVLDRNATCRLATGELFAAHGAIVAEAANASAALEAIRNSRREAHREFDLLIVDCSHPEAGGLELACRLGARKSRSAIPLIATLGSHELSAGLARLREVGLEHYLVKPLKRAELIAAALEVVKLPAGDRAEIPHGNSASGAPAAFNIPSPSAALAPPSTEPIALPAGVAAVAQKTQFIPEADTPALSATVPECRILLADDSADNRMLIRAYLGKTAYGLDEAENGQVAVDKLKSGHYDLVLMDIQMPVMDGYSAVQCIRRWERERGVRHTPIIALTASAFDETVRKAAEAGCDSHLDKPLKRSTLLRVIRETALANNATPSEQAA